MRGAGGQDGRVGEVICGDFQEFCGVGQSVDLSQNDRVPSQCAEKRLRLRHVAADARQLAVEVLDVRQALREDCLADPAHSLQPDDTPALPGLPDPPQPITSRIHATIISFS